MELVPECDVLFFDSCRSATCCSSTRAGVRRVELVPECDVWNSCRSTCGTRAGVRAELLPEYVRNCCRSEFGTVAGVNAELLPE